jgi:hypothetical protein
MTLASVNVFPDPVTPIKVDFPGRAATNCLIASGWLPAGWYGAWRLKRFMNFASKIYYKFLF